MGKMVIPKNSASIEEVMGAMQIYYDADDWLSNADYIQAFKNRIGIIGDDGDSSAYTKRTEIGSYYGFIEWEDINKTQSPRRITPRGKQFLEHYNAGDTAALHEDIMCSLEEVTFGRNNYACRSSDSDIDPPALFLRAVMDLGYLTNTEFAYLVYQMEYMAWHYTETVRSIQACRDRNESVVLPDEGRKFSDPKPILMLERWGVLTSSQASGSKRTSISTEFLAKYARRLRNLKIYNVDKNVGNDTAGTATEERPVSRTVVIEELPENLSVQELGVILSAMYNEGKSKVAGIHMFGVKYGPIITKNGYTANAIVTASGLNASYNAELSKGLCLYEAMINNEYGIRFFDGEETDSEDGKTFDNLPTLAARTRCSHSLNSILYGAPGTGKTYSTAQWALAIAENKDYAVIAGEPRADVMTRYNALVEAGQIVFTTFHQNYGYEDFIQGIRPDTSSGEMKFKTVDGAFKVISQTAMATPEKDFVIIIDEINRANISKVFGELITLIEDDKRWGEGNAISVTLPSGEIFAVPNNLYIIGTMNSADKSISLIDTALRRRFEFVEFTPQLNLISDGILKNVLQKLNEGIESQLNSSDLLIGHSYFIGRTADELAEIMNRSIIPLLYEYFFDDKKKVEAQLKKVLEGLDYEVVNTSMGRLKVSKKAG